MDSFDPKDYEQRVVRPLRGRTGPLPDDLVTRYELRLDFTDADVAERVAQVRSHWNKSARSSAKSPYLQRVYKAFLRADAELRDTHGDDMLRISWWREHDAARTGARGQQVDELVAMLRTNFGELGLITSGQLNAMRETFGQLTPDEVDQALETTSVRLSTPIELPRTSGLSDTLYRRLKALLADAERTSVAELLHEELTALRILTSFGSIPVHRTGLTAEAVRDAVEREDRRSGNQAVREALGLLNTAVKSGVDLRSLTLFHLLDDVRKHHANRAPASVLLRHLRLAHVAEDEARLAVVSVLGETGGPGPETPAGLPKVTELLDGGLLAAAQQALAGITDAEEAKAARELVRRQQDRVREHRDAAHRELAAGQEGSARRRLRQAVELSADDDGLSAELRRIPLPPAPEVSAHPVGLGVRVSWRPSADHEDGTRYRLLRQAGRLPADPEDGEVVADGLDSVALDSGVPAGIAVGYAVFAAVERGSWSRPAGAEIEVLPPVHDVRLKAAKGAIEASWEAHPDVVAVEVFRSDRSGDEPITTTGTTSFRDDRTDPAAHCTYVLIARYRGAGGIDRAASAVRVESSSQATPSLPPMTGLRARRFDEELVLSWTWPEQVRIAEIGWTGPAGAELRRLTRQEYQAAGGCRIKPGPGSVLLRVSGIAEDGAARSAPAEVDVRERPPNIGYTVRRRSRLLPGGGTARITLTADQRVAECAVLVVVAPGRVMPVRPGDGQVVHRVEREFAPDEPVEATVELPKLRRPYWLRCFAETPGVRLVDPPTAQLKAT